MLGAGGRGDFQVWTPDFEASVKLNLCRLVTLKAQGMGLGGRGQHSLRGKHGMGSSRMSHSHTSMVGLGARSSPRS